MSGFFGERPACEIGAITGDEAQALLLETVAAARSEQAPSRLAAGWARARGHSLRRESTRRSDEVTVRRRSPGEEDFIGESRVVDSPSPRGSICRQRHSFLDRLQAQTPSSRPVRQEDRQRQERDLPARRCQTRRDPNWVRDDNAEPVVAPDIDSESDEATYTDRSRG